MLRPHFFAVMALAWNTAAICRRSSCTLEAVVDGVQCGQTFDWLIGEKLGWFRLQAAAVIHRRSQA